MNKEELIKTAQNSKDLFFRKGTKFMVGREEYSIGDAYHPSLGKYYWVMKDGKPYKMMSETRLIETVPQAIDKHILQKHGRKFRQKDHPGELI